MNGIELVTQIKRLDPKVNAVLMTALDIDSIKPELEKYDYEIDEIFQKPLSVKTLCERIRMQLDNE